MNKNADLIKPLLSYSQINVLGYDIDSLAVSFSDAIVDTYCEMFEIDKEEFNRKYSSKGKSIVVENLLDQISLATTNLRSAQYYRFTENFYDCVDYNAFTDSLGARLRMSYDFGSNILIISGKAGVGKSTFFSNKKGFGEFLEQRLHITTESSRKMHHIIDFRPENEKEVGASVAICENFLREEINTFIASKIYSNSNFSKEFDLFYKENYTEESKNDVRFYENVRFCSYCKMINETLATPLIFVIDNIDLCEKSMQDNIWNAVKKLNTSIKETAEDNIDKLDQKKIKYIFILAMRPETKRNDEIKLYEELNFPSPKLLDIFTENFTNCLDFIVRDTVNNKIGYKNYDKFGDIIEDVKKTILKIKNVDWNTADVKERLGDYDSFHKKIVNSSVRRFLNFIGLTIANGGYRPLREWGKSENEFTVYEYIKMLIRGFYEFHPGNQKMDGEGFDNRSPIVMSLFDFSEWNTDKKALVDNYLIYIRLLQYIEMKADSRYVTLEDIINEMTCFYKKEHILIALKKLLFANVILEVNIGVRNIQNRKRWRDIKFEEDKYGEIHFVTDGSCSSGFYLTHLLCEYEYLYQMAVTTYLLVEKDDSDEQTKEHYKFIKEIISQDNIDKRKRLITNNQEKITFIFIKSIFIAINKNLDFYIEQKVIEKCYLLFRTNHDTQYLHPWSRLMSRYINVLKIKQQNGTYSIQRQSAIEKLVKEAEELYQKAEDIFKQKLSHGTNAHVDDESLSWNE